MHKKKRTSQCKLLHPTVDEVREEFRKEVESRTTTTTAPDELALVKLNIIKEWKSKGRRTDNLGETWFELLHQSLNIPL